MQQILILDLFAKLGSSQTQVWQQLRDGCLGEACGHLEVSGIAQSLVRLAGGGQGCLRQ